MSRIYVRKVAVQVLQLRRKWQSMSRICVRKVAVASLPIKKKIAVPCTSKEKLQFVFDWCFLWPLFPTGLLILVVSSRRKRTHNYSQYKENIIYFPNKDYKKSVSLEMFEGRSMPCFLEFKDCFVWYCFYNFYRGYALYSVLYSELYFLRSSKKNLCFPFWGEWILLREGAVSFCWRKS